MSGIAIIIKGADFSKNNIGKISLETSLQSIVILGSDSVTGITSNYTADYTPSNTTQTGVTWSITSGSDYASIDSSTGVLTVKSGASNSSVTIQATSTANASINATKVVAVTYSASTALQSIAISGSDTVTGTTSQYSVTYTPTNTTQTGVTWSITSGSDYASIDSSTGVLTVKSGASNSSVTIQATSTANASIVATKKITVTVTDNIITDGLRLNLDALYNTGNNLHDTSAAGWYNKVDNVLQTWYNSNTTNPVINDKSYDFNNNGILLKNSADQFYLQGLGDFTLGFAFFINLSFTSGANVAVNLLWDVGIADAGCLGFSIECNSVTGISIDTLSPLLQIRYPTTQKWTAYRPINFNDGVKMNNNAYNIIYIVRKGNSVSFYVNGNKLLYSVSNDMYNTPVTTTGNSKYTYVTLLSAIQTSSTPNLTLQVRSFLMYSSAYI